MNFVRMASIIVMAAGVLALVYGGFSYTKENTAAKLGPVELKVQEHKEVNVPVWAGLAAIAAGALVLVGTARR